jgi:hypothetical protein
MAKLSILIPSRNEMFLARTVEDLLQNIEGDTEILVGLDGEWAEPTIQDNPRVTILHTSESIGQRAMTNQLARLSKAKYVMKVDAHCAFDKGFDVKMMADMQDNYTMVPVMRNLHAFNWVCPDGHTRYQGPSGVCTECGKETVRDVVWIAKTNPQSTSYCFDSEPHFQYFKEFKSRPEGKGNLTESMSLQGSCFMMTRDKYWELNICDETFGSWGSQGIEVAVKTWTSGGRVVVNHKTWYAHMFRTQGGDFSFPYENPGRKVEGAKKMAKERFLNKDIVPLLEKFWPVPGWTQADLDSLKLTKGILYYTDNQLPMKIAWPVRKYLKKAGLPITSVSLKKTKLGNNIVFDGVRGKLTLFKQILTGLEAMTEDVVFFTEHDVIYHKSHFDFTPTEDKFYYNLNNWRVREDGLAVYFDHDSLSQMCCFRKIAIEEFKRLIKKYEEKPFNGGFEPGTRDGRSLRWTSEEPNIDIRHDNNFTPSRWSQDKFRDKSTCTNWKEGHVKDLWIKEIKWQ